MTIETFTITTPVGPLRVEAEDDVVGSALFLDEQARPTRSKHPVAARLRAYLDGDIAAIDPIKVAQPGTPFRLAVWEALRRIPAGTTISYRELASEAGNPKAIRAAGTSCGMNQIALIVPCHRVVRTGGGLGGYGGGLDRKKWLLGHERAAGGSLGRSGGALLGDARQERLELVSR